MEYPTYLKIILEDGNSYMRIDSPTTETWIHINGAEKNMLNGQLITESTHTIEKRVVSSIPFLPKGFMDMDEHKSNKLEFDSIVANFVKFLGEQD